MLKSKTQTSARKTKKNGRRRRTKNKRTVKMDKTPTSVDSLM